MNNYENFANKEIQNLIYIQNYLPIIIAFAFNNRVKVSSVVSMAFDFLHCRISICKKRIL